jgi:hypothetical protein
MQLVVVARRFQNVSACALKLVPRSSAAIKTMRFMAILLAL